MEGKPLIEKAIRSWRGEAEGKKDVSFLS